MITRIVPCVTPTIIICTRLFEDHGLRNCNLLAIAPTATISNICGVYPSIEPQYSNYYAKTNLSGNFINMNPYLWNELNN